jgi:hypothetical protein
MAGRCRQGPIRAPSSRDNTRTRSALPARDPGAIGTILFLNLIRLWNADPSQFSGAWTYTMEVEFRWSIIEVGALLVFSTLLADYILRGTLWERKRVPDSRS